MGGLLVYSHYHLINLDNLHISHRSRQVAATRCGHRGSSGGTSSGTSGGSRGASEARVPSRAGQIAVQRDRAWSAARRRGG